jgi:hypothetical protein
MSVIESLTKSIATTATGYAAIINGVLDMTTASDSRRAAAMKGLIIAGVHPLVVMHTDCQDPGCGCMEEWLKDRYPDSRIVAVKVEVSE